MIVLLEGYLADRSDDRVGHLNSILARVGGNLNDPIFTSSNTRAFSTLGGGGGMLKFRADRRIKLNIANLKLRLFCLKVSLKI